MRFIAGTSACPHQVAFTHGCSSWTRAAGRSCGLTSKRANWQPEYLGFFRWPWRRRRPVRVPDGTRSMVADGSTWADTANDRRSAWSYRGTTMEQGRRRNDDRRQRRHSPTAAIDSKKGGGDSATTGAHDHLWRPLRLILAAVPALADGGPYVLTANNGTLGINADGCAVGATATTRPRARSSSTPSTRQLLRKTCHVRRSPLDPRSTSDWRPVLPGRLRRQRWHSSSAPFGAAASRTPGRCRNASRLLVFLERNRCFTAAEGRCRGVRAVTSAHLKMTENGLISGVAWGNGAVFRSRPCRELGCVSCHNPHGNGSTASSTRLRGHRRRRLRRPLGGRTSATVALDDRIYTEVSHGPRSVTSSRSPTPARPPPTAGRVVASVMLVYGVPSGGYWFTLTGVDILANTGVGGTRPTGLAASSSPTRCSLRPRLPATTP